MVKVHCEQCDETHASVTRFNFTLGLLYSTDIFQGLSFPCFKMENKN